MNEVMETAQNADIYQWIQWILMWSGGSTIVVAALQKTVDPLREWAKQSESKADDKWVERWFRLIGFAAALLQGVKAIAAVGGVRPRAAPLKDK